MSQSLHGPDAASSDAPNLAERSRHRQVVLRGHFADPVRIETLDHIGDDVLLARVRTADGLPDETTITVAELEAALAEAAPAAAVTSPADLFRWIESHRIATAFAHDPYFAVSLSGVRGLPHQVEAVYRHLLPQPLLRFVLADDPGAGKTIMAGLLIKELKFRGVVERVLVVSPAPLTIQWQDEMLDRFDERFEIISSVEVRQRLGGNPWQAHAQVVTSLDFAKRDDVLPDLLRAEWDLVVIDEAHKCSAWTDKDGIRRTRRYALAEELARRTTRLVLLTATPHSGDEDRFTHFLALLDPDQFATAELVKRQITVDGNPYFLRRQKEDLRDEHGRPLFVPRHVQTQPFTLSTPEKDLYDKVTAYINNFLAPVGGGRGNAVALARTVLQRRLASSLGAIHSSLLNRAARLEKQADELATMTPAERQRRLVALGRIDLADEETSYDDADEETQEEAAIAVSAAEHIEGLRTEVVELRRLSALTESTMHLGEERKLGALRSCLEKAEFAEVRDGRGKLLIFTEHRDTLEYLQRHLREWGYSVCSIHGGHPAATRKAIQYEFLTNRQICVATEAAGEGINLQFCHLMINYDLPWNPVRLEQRMGRIHRIGQKSDVYVFNFCATNTVEGQLLERLHHKLDDMREALSGRVYDVIGDVLALNGVDFERLVRDTLANPRRLDASLDQISAMSAERLREYERMIGIAQATRSVDLSWVRRHDWESQERRLMPEYVQDFFLDAADQVGLRVQQRADGLLRIEHVLSVLRSDDLEAVRRRGRAQAEYRKVTFRKEDRDRAEHEDAILMSPGHPLFAAIDEVLRRQLARRAVPEATAAFVDPAASVAYRLHFVAYDIVGETQQGRAESAFGETLAVIEDPDGTLTASQPHLLHDLTHADNLTETVEPPAGEQVERVVNWVRSGPQRGATAEQRVRRLEQADLRTRYLTEAFAAQEVGIMNRWQDYDERVQRGEEQYRLQRDEAQRRLEELKRRQRQKLQQFAHLGNVRPGRVVYLGCAAVFPPQQRDDPVIRTLRPDPEVERRAMEVAMAYEREHGREPDDVSARHDGSGFDIRSVEPPNGEQEPQVRRIEVKGLSAQRGDVGLYRTEWYAARRFREGYWLYVVTGARGDKERLLTIQDPWGRLRDSVEEIAQVTGYRIPAGSIEEAAR